MNTSGGLIHENRLAINNLIDYFNFLNETSVNTHEDIESLFVTRSFLLVHGEVQIHNQRLKVFLDKLNNNICHFESHLDVLSMGKLSPAISDPLHLQIELADMENRTPTLMVPKTLQ